jgi:hypothetical protein
MKKYGPQNPKDIPDEKMIIQAHPKSHKYQKPGRTNDLPARLLLKP